MTFNLKNTSLFFLYLFLSNIYHAVESISFDLEATSFYSPFCIRNNGKEKENYLVNIKSTGNSDDGQNLIFKVFDQNGNKFREKKNFFGEIKFAFISQISSPIDICFVNFLTNSKNKKKLTRSITLELKNSESEKLEIDQQSKNLLPINDKIKSIEFESHNILRKFNILKQREARMRNTNESTNARIKNFSLTIIMCLIFFGVWQIYSLKRYFMINHII